MSELKSCPFCGGEAVMRANNFIHCKDIVNCGAQVESNDFGSHTKQHTIEAWNRRANGE